MVRNTPECIEKLTNKTARNKQAQFSNYRQTPNEKEKKNHKAKQTNHLSKAAKNWCAYPRLFTYGQNEKQSIATIRIKENIKKRNKIKTPT